MQQRYLPGQQLHLLPLHTRFTVPTLYGFVYRHRITHISVNARLHMPQLHRLRDIRFAYWPTSLRRHDAASMISTPRGKPLRSATPFPLFRRQSACFEDDDYYGFFDFRWHWASMAFESIWRWLSPFRDARLRYIIYYISIYRAIFLYHL
jgi:hypothetical protein